MRLSVKSSEDCRRSLGKIINQTAAGTIEPRVANCLIYGVNSALAAIRIDEQERRLAELERLVTEIEGERQ